ncbi:LPXTG cell wall anchor domain-containing protein [Microbacterium aquimaris]|uniref:LPXTG cell wall anchor domain-containing protein n=1 Tax=Microbacterium aquimaris TaxID=459816 RepID=A0ABU5N4Z9_9MICO|nr:LPXTG cell wall anchor domain-containing protein [Microbacterium aquimaris]MDZ8161143.1 LPXTG cell wall anchor domain-containing protein [Microbacterium aquimaris]
MTRRFTRVLTAAALAGGLVAAPGAAQASTIYPPAGSCTTSPATMTAGSTITFACSAGTFSADEPVTVTVTGENGADATFGMVRMAISTASSTFTSTSDGALDGIRITLPTNATGTYNIAAVSPTSAGGTAAASITTAEGLPTTGLDQDSLAIVWIGGGALLAAGAVLAVVAGVRRSRDRNS